MNKNFMTRDKEFKEKTLNEIKQNFQPINFNQQYQPVNMMPRFSMTEFMMSILPKISNHPQIVIDISEDVLINNKIIRENIC